MLKVTEYAVNVTQYDLLMLHLVYVFSQAMNIIVVFSHLLFTCIGSIRMS